jgi:hypothetical protein
MGTCWVDMDVSRIFFSLIADAGIPGSAQVQQTHGGRPTEFPARAAEPAAV